MRISDLSPDVCPSDAGADEPARPLVAIVAGSKVRTKLELLSSVVGKVDQLIVGGGIANTFIAAEGFGVGKSLFEADLVDTAKQIMADAKARGADIPVPTDVVVRSEEHTSELQSLMRISYAVFCLKQKIIINTINITVTLRHFFTTIYCHL